MNWIDGKKADSKIREICVQELSEYFYVFKYLERVCVCGRKKTINDGKLVQCCWFSRPTITTFFLSAFSSSMSTTRCNITPKSRQLSSDKPWEHYLSKAFFKCWTKVRDNLWQALLLTTRPFLYLFCCHLAIRCGNLI